MASIVAYIELRAGLVTRPSFHVLAEARRVADQAGATVYALFTVGDLGQARIDQIASELSAAGADRILCSSADALAGPALDPTHGPILAQVAEHLRPLLFVFPAGGPGTQLGPPLAIRIGAAYLANASLDIVEEEQVPPPPSRRVLLSRWRAAHDGQRRIDVGELERPVVATLCCGLAPDKLGEPYAEVEMLPYTEAAHSGPVLVDSEADPAATVELCSAMVWTASPTHVAAALPDGIPAGVAVIAAGPPAPEVVATASPSELFWFPPAQPPERLLGLLTPGARIAWVAENPERTR